MRVLIQALLVGAALLLVVASVARMGARAQAIRRLGMLIFGAFAITSVIVPEIWTGLAKLLGIGRGADLLLYLLTVSFLTYVFTSSRRQRESERRTTALARQLALLQAWDHYGNFESTKETQ